MMVVFKLNAASSAGARAERGTTEICKERALVVFDYSFVCLRSCAFQRRPFDGC